MDCTEDCKALEALVNPDLDNYLQRVQTLYKRHKYKSDAVRMEFLQAFKKDHTLPADMHHIILVFSSFESDVADGFISFTTLLHLLGERRIRIFIERVAPLYFPIKPFLPVSHPHVSKLFWDNVKIKYNI